MSESIKSARGYDGTVARIAGNLLSGREEIRYMPGQFSIEVATKAVAWARLIVAETKRTEPTSQDAS